MMRKVTVSISKTQWRALKYAKRNNNQIRNVIGTRIWGCSSNGGDNFRTRTINTLIKKGLLRQLKDKSWIVELTERSKIFLNLEPIKGY